MMEKVFQSYYTNSEPIVNYMVNKLNIGLGDLILEPCAGDGVFIDRMLLENKENRIEAFEINPEAIDVLKKKYNVNNNITIEMSNILENKKLLSIENKGGEYDKIIGNPPYGGWINYIDRLELKKQYPFLYVKETYTLFLYKMLKLLKDGGKLSFIIPDTFLNLHMHTKFREILFKNVKIEEILLFPSSFFPGVNFGYSNLSIISLKKNNNIEENYDNEFKVITGFKTVEEIINIENEENLKIHYFYQRDVLKNLDFALFISEDNKMGDLINNSEYRISDFANCVTGIYTGNDKEYLRTNKLGIKNGKKYFSISENEIEYRFDNCQNILEGIEGEKKYIPIYKGGGQAKYKKETNWFIDWSKNSVSIYKNNKKARFQNSDFYFKKGIGVPMIRTKKMNSFIIENNLFDQSIVGIFPKEEKYTYYLLALLNSKIASDFINIINPTTNNSANYIKKIPVIKPSQSILEKINHLVEEILNNEERIEEIEEEINRLFYDLYGL